MNTERRGFIKRIATGAVLAGVGARAVPVAEHTLTVEAEREKTDPSSQVQRRPLGRIGKEVSILGLGLGSAFTKPHARDPEKAAELLERALQHGINYWDTARAYGPSESLIGPVVEKHREDIFLVSKSGNRSYDGFMRDIEKSLKLLRTDHIDLYHIHNLQPKKDKDLDVIEKGAARAAAKAKEQGLIKHFGITGHSGAAILIDGITRWNPDAVLTIFPCNRPDGGKYEDKLLPLARKRKMGVIAMKTVRFARQADLKGTDLIRYAMSLDGVHTAIVGLDSLAHLDENATMASDFKPLTNKQRAQMTWDVRLALEGLMAPWDRPGYDDHVLV